MAECNSPLTSMDCASSSDTVHGDATSPVCYSAELAQLLRETPDQIILLDCRATCNDEPAILRAQKVLLPTVLMRRLNNGTLSPSSLCPSLADAAPNVRVILIPDRRDHFVMAKKVFEMLTKRGFHAVIFEDDLHDFQRHHPALVQSSSQECFDSPTQPAGLNFRLFTDKFSPENMKTKPNLDELFPAQIFNCVFLGNDSTAKNKELLQSCGINYVINVTSDLPNYFHDDPCFNYLRIPVDDSYAHNLSQYFPDAIQFIEKARAENTSVLVHCMAGISRSVTVCLAYLMYAMQCSLDDAFDRLLHQNGSIQPNFHFMESLLCWEREIRQQIGQLVRDENRTSSMPSSSSSATSSACSSA